MENQTVTHVSLNSRYRVVFEKAPSANRIDGFKVEINADAMEEAEVDGAKLYHYALMQVEANKPVQPISTK